MPLFDWTIDEDIRWASTLPAEVYSNPVYFGAAAERVFSRSWQLVADTDAVRVPGQTHPFTLLEGMLDEPLVLDNVERRFEMPLGLGGFLGRSSRSAKTFVHRPLHRRLVFGEPQGIIKHTRGFVEASLAEGDFGSDARVQIRPIAPELCRDCVLLFGPCPFTARHVRIREVQCPECGGIA